ncbi:MAG: hypothetical protein NCA08_00170 [Deltaproteobacteria bacterium]|nr:hypothetical protein [Candidatus Deferrimicrobium borealis]
MTPRRDLLERRVARPLFRWIVPAAAILLAAAGFGVSAESVPTTSTGARVTKSVPFARESIDEIRALDPTRSQAVPEGRTIPFHRIPRRPDATGDARSPLAGPALAAPLLASSPSPSAPAPDSSFAGLGNPPRSEGDVIPPDTMGAAGPNHLVSILNSDFGVFGKATGQLLQKRSLQSFWGSLGTAPGEPANFPFDPKILYDQHSGRFVAVTLGGRTPSGSWIMIAVSPPSDPTGAWSKWAIDADLDNNVQQFNNVADFPGLGVDAFNVYVTANMFDGPSAQYSKVWVIPKTQLLAASPPATITWFEFRDPPGSDFTMQPAHTFGTPGVEYILFEGAVNHLGVAWIDNLAGTPAWNFPLQVPVTPYASNFLPGAPQPGTDCTVDTADTRLLNAVYRNGSVWATHNVAGPSGKVEVAWYRINPGTGAVESQGRINDPSLWYYYPSVAVNKDNVAAIGFSGSSTGEYIGGYYTIIQPSTGTAEPVVRLKAGEATYVKVFSGGENRWGDFSATTVDPTDDTSFWTLQEYAMTHDSFVGADNNVVDRSRWGTWWGKFTPGHPPPPPPSSGDDGGGGCLTISRPGNGSPDAASLFSVGILLLPACALGLRRFFRRQGRTVPIRHPLC